MTIETQKRTGTCLLTDITDWTKKSAVIAGGAIRDWELGYSAVDLDLYMQSDPTVSNARFKHFLQWMLEDHGYYITDDVKQIDTDGVEGAEYCLYSGSDIQGVFEVTLDVGPIYQRVQFIRLLGNPEEVMQTFPMSTSQGMMLRDGSILHTQKFSESMQKKVAWFNPDQLSMRYMSKMMRKPSLAGFVFAPKGREL